MLKGMQLEGVTGWWVKSDMAEAKINSASLSEDGAIFRLSLDHDGYHYNAILHKSTTSDIKFEGKFSADKKGSAPSTGDASCRLVKDGDDVFLFGYWIEDGFHNYWGGELYLA